MNESKEDAQASYTQTVKIKCGDTIKEYRYKRQYNITNKTKMFKELLNEDETKKILSSNVSNYDKITNLWTYISNNEKYKKPNRDALASSKDGRTECFFNYKQIQNLVYRNSNMKSLN